MNSTIFVGDGAFFSGPPHLLTSSLCESRGVLQHQNRRAYCLQKSSHCFFLKRGFYEKLWVIYERGEIFSLALSKLSQALTDSHKLSQALTRSHRLSQLSLTLTRLSQALTSSHRLSQALTGSHRLSLTLRGFLLVVWCGWQHVFCGGQT